MSDDWKVAKGTALEDIVAKLLRGWGFDIQTRVRAQDKSGVEHEIDVLGKKVEAFGDFTLAVECKNHVEPIDIVQIRNFNGTLELASSLDIERHSITVRNQIRLRNRIYGPNSVFESYLEVVNCGREDPVSQRFVGRERLFRHFQAPPSCLGRGA